MFEVDENIIMYAFRYSLGRKTYSVEEVSALLINNWGRFKSHTKEQIIREIETAIERNEAGMECDINAWKSVLLLLEEAIKGSD